MHYILSVAAFFVVALIILTGYQSSASPLKTEKVIISAAAQTEEHNNIEEAPRISLANAKKEFDAGTALFIDTRGDAAYKIEHIKGAVSISSDNLKAHLKELPKDRKIIAYCS